MTSFLGKNYLVASIIIVKAKYLNECFTSFKELHLIGEKLQQLFNDTDLEVCVNTYQIDEQYFNISSDIISVREDISIDDIIDLMLYVPDAIAEVLNDEFICSELIKIKEEEIKVLKIKK